MFHTGTAGVPPTEYRKLDLAKYSNCSARNASDTTAEHRKWFSSNTQTVRRNAGETPAVPEITFVRIQENISH